MAADSSYENALIDSLVSGGDSSALSAGDSIVDNSIGEEPVNEDVEDPELEAIKQRVKEMEEEAEKLKVMQKEAEDQLKSPLAATPASMEKPDQQELDARSVYVGNVDYSATAAELEQHFHGCGAVNRVTILCDKFSGHPKGFAYVEFADKDSVENACSLTDSLFKGRQIKVNAKRTNVVGYSSTDRGRGRGYRGRGRARGGFTSFAPRARGRGAFRSRRAQWFSPY